MTPINTLLIQHLTRQVRGAKPFLKRWYVPQLVKKKTPHVLWDPKVHYRIHKSLSLFPSESTSSPRPPPQTYAN